MATVYLGLGTNLGDRRANVRRALTALAPDFQITAASRLYETEPAYLAEQPRFYNLAVRAETALGPLAALRGLKAREVELGRTASPRFGPRLIDLDLLFYDDLQLDTPELTLPHPRLPERAFVLVPLAEIAAEMAHPALGVSVAQLLARLGDTRALIWPVL